LETDKPTDEELVKWSAELMGLSKDGEYYRIVKPDGSYGNRVSLTRNWNPIYKSNGQIWDVMERMEEMEWEYRSQSICKAHYFRFFKKQDNKSDKYGEAYATTPVRAILLAAWRAVEGKR
jgi:hypothetical protein